MSVEEARDKFVDAMFDTVTKRGMQAAADEAFARLILEVRHQAFWEVWQLYCPCGNPDHDPPMRALLRESPLVVEEEEAARKELGR